MPVPESEQKGLEEIRQLIADRAFSYEVGVQTTILGRQPDGWRNLLSKFDFVCKGRSIPDPVRYQYPNVIIVRRLIETPRLSGILLRLFQDSTLETGTEPEYVAMRVRLSHHEPVRSWRREWSEWPGDIAHFDLANSQDRTRPPQTSLVAVDAPYYPSAGQAMLDLFEFRPINDSDYLAGNIILVVPDFRARISMLTLGRDYLRAEFDCVFAKPPELVVKAYAENSSRKLAQQTCELAEPLLEINLNDRATFVSVALLSKSTGELLHEKSFDEKRGWVDEKVIIKVSEQEIDQMLLLGETETLEFREKIEPVRLAKTIVAFANTRGGTIIVGVDDNHRVVGCDPKGYADTVTNIVRDRCDPPIPVATEVVEHQGRTLFLIRLAESKEHIHVEREHGPLIRVNGTTRTPRSYELERLCQRRNAPGTLFASPIS